MDKKHIIENINDEQRQHLELLKQKLDALERMLNVSKKSNFTCKKEVSDQEADAFVDLMQKRDNILAKIEKIDYNIANVVAMLQCMTFEQSTYELEKEQLDSLIKVVAGKIIDIDKINNNAAAQIFEYLKENVKQVRQTKVLTSKYNPDDDYRGLGYYLDKKN